MSGYKIERGPKASIVAENPGKECQGVLGRVESPRGVDTPGMEELPQGYETSGVNPEGDVVPGANGQGQGGDENSSAYRDTEARRDTSSGKEMASGPGPADP